MLITIEDVKTRGYDLTKDGALLQGDFLTIQDSAKQFIKECCDMIWALIEKHRGVNWTNLFKKDMESTSLTGNALRYQEVLKNVMLEQIVFIYENGDINASATKDDTKRSISPKVITKLYNYGIIKM